MRPKIVIIGSTGKLGSKLLNYTLNNGIRVYAATCFNSKLKLSKQQKKYDISKTFILSDQNDREKFLNFLSSKIDIIYFLDFGSFSLIYLNQFLKFNSNSIVAIANKEMIIAGGKLLFDKIKKTKNKFIPLDSEHFSLKNSLLSKNIYKIYITASGGPFFYSNKNSFSKVSLKEVIAHPKWKMGINNSIDSSNFMNKLLEIYELSYIYDISIDKIDFIISKEAFVHSLVEYDDGIISLNTFKNDMLISLINPLSYFFDLNKKQSSKRLIMNQQNFRFDNKFDNRFNFFSFYKKMRKLSHAEQIKLLILNNHAQKLYLSNKLKYKDIIPYIMHNIHSYFDYSPDKSLLTIVKYINLLKLEIQNA